MKSRVELKRKKRRDTGLCMSHKDGCVKGNKEKKLLERYQGSQDSLLLCSWNGWFHSTFRNSFIPQCNSWEIRGSGKKTSC
ncbi:hypothetical protein RRG08_026114 [Elysia crispata]|uniref:Uncharacterized protein n=1 Tax=Elysia crispata TaxID=231223 RepID=A0AAE0YR94_9GAST|nr:hypothetical protein RRG08_026114 [Elysia crispata]